MAALTRKRKVVTPQRIAPTLPSEIAAFTPRSNAYLDLVNSRFGHPHPKQALAMLLPHMEILFGGQAGGGKSDWLLRSALQYVDVQGYNAIIFRKSYASLVGLDGLVPRSMEWLSDTDARWNSEERTWFFPSGAALKFGYLDSPKDKFQYASTAYSFIGFEELTEWASSADFEFMFSRLRRPKRVQNVPLRMRATTNPIGPGFEWVRDRFVPLNEDGVPQPIKTQARCFVPSALEDNPSIDKDEYDRALANLSYETYEKLRRGSWNDLVRGQLLPSDFAQVVFSHDLPDWQNPAIQYSIVRYWDLAGTKPDDNNKDPDYTVGFMLAKVRMTPKTPEVYYILDVVELRDTFDVVFEALQETAKRDGIGVYLRSEQDPAQAGKAQISTIARLLSGQGFNYAGFLARGSKETRASGFSSAWRAGQVFMLSAPWNKRLIHYFDKFPTHGIKDDHVDAATGAFNFLQGASPRRLPATKEGGRNRHKFDPFYQYNPGWGPRPG